MHALSERIPRSWLQAYYWATSLFFLADLTLGVSLRAAALPSPTLRYLYYFLCLGCAWACRRWPASAPWVGMTESAVNILLLILSVMLPVFSLTDAVLAGEPIPPPMTTGKLLNFVLSGTVLWLSFQRSQSAVFGRVTRRNSGP